MHWYDAFITKTPDVQGGEPCIAGTRTSVRAVVTLAGIVYPEEPYEIGRALSHLETLQVVAALAYFKDNRQEIFGHMIRHHNAFLAANVEEGLRPYSDADLSRVADKAAMAMAALAES